MEIFYSMAESIVNKIVGGPGSKITAVREKEIVNRGIKIQNDM